MTILVTGGSGFIAKGLCKYLKGINTPVKLLSREDFSILCNLSPFESSLPEVVNKQCQLVKSLSDCEVVIHLAAKAHDTRPIFWKNFEYLLAEYRRINVGGTLNLARMCSQAGIKRFIYLSSIKVNGESTLLNSPFRRESPPNPTDPYGISKYEAEKGLLEIAKQTGLEVVIIRPPLVYGIGVKANFMSLIRLISSGAPIPLGAISHNFRSFVSLDNLIDLIHLTIRHPSAKNDIFLISDGHDVSTSDLVCEISLAMDKRCMLLRVPLIVLRVFFGMIGRHDQLSRLMQNLQIDISYTSEVLGWQPVYTMQKSLKGLFKKL